MKLKATYDPQEHDRLVERFGHFGSAEDIITNTVDELSKAALGTGVDNRFASPKIRQDPFDDDELTALVGEEETQSVNIEFATTTTTGIVSDTTAENVFGFSATTSE